VRFRSFFSLFAAISGGSIAAINLLVVIINPAGYAVAAKAAASKFRPTLSPRLHWLMFNFVGSHRQSV